MAKEKNLEAKLSPRDALKAAKAYVHGLDIPYKVKYGSPNIINYKRKDPTKPSNEENRIPGEYGVSVTVVDKDKTEVYFNLYIDSETGKLREESVWNPNAKQIYAALEGKRQHYVLIMTETEKEAKRISNELYSKKGIVSVVYGGKELVRQMQANAVLAWAHGARHNGKPKSVKVKTQEKRRESLVRKCQVLSEFSRE